MAQRPLCTILMATFNGMPYIEEQIASIQWQTEANWRLLVSDDGSTDGTLGFLKSAAQADSRIQVISNCGTHGAYSNFFNALNACKGGNEFDCANELHADYYFFADQDDVWEPEKIETMVGELKRLELQTSIKQPAFCYANRVLVDADGGAFGRVTSEFSDLDERGGLLTLFFWSGYVAGTSMAFNNALLDMASWPEETFNEITHDGYLARYGIIHGSFSYIRKPLVRYRRHGKNATNGMWIKPRSLPYVINAIFNELPKRVEKGAQVLWASMVFLNHPRENDEASKELRSCIETGGLMALGYCFKHRIFPRGSFLATCFLYLNLLTKAYKHTRFFSDKRYLAAMEPDIS